MQVRFPLTRGRSGNYPVQPHVHRTFSCWMSLSRLLPLLPGEQWQGSRADRRNSAAVSVNALETRPPKGEPGHRGGGGLGRMEADGRRHSPVSDQVQPRAGPLGCGLAAGHGTGARGSRAAVDGSGVSLELPHHRSSRNHGCRTGEHPPFLRRRPASGP